MVFFSMMEQNLPLLQQGELIFRIILAALCGAAVGTERSRRFKDAGVRTHCMVACTAAAIMILSKYGFADLASPDGIAMFGVHGGDPARIAAQVVSGISFLGVGIIYRDKEHATRGLTTAAGIWAVAAIGMAIGAGLYLIGLFNAAFVVLIQVVMHRYAIGADGYVRTRLHIVMTRDDTVLEQFNQKMNCWKITILSSSVRRMDDGLLSYDMVIRAPSGQGYQCIKNYILEDSRIQSIQIGGEY